MSERIAALARRVEDDQFFLGQALSTYARAEGLNDVQLAQLLGCTPAQLSAVCLCRKPRTSLKEFQQDVERIATAFQVDRMIIAEAVRLADSLRALGQLHRGGGYLMAARDRGTNEAHDEPEEAGEI